MSAYYEVTAVTSVLPKQTHRHNKKRTIVAGEVVVVVVAAAAAVMIAIINDGISNESIVLQARVFESLRCACLYSSGKTVSDAEAHHAATKLKLK